jgi:hypothetical protein
MGATRIVDKLNGMGTKPRTSDFWNKSAVMSILGNEHHIGKIRRQYKTSIHIVEGQTIEKKRRKNADYKVFEGRHEAIIDEELFYRVKDKRDKMPKLRKSSKLVNPLASFFYCRCGFAMSMRDGKDCMRYLCTNSKICRTSSVPCSEVIEAVCEHLRKCIEDFTVELGKSDNRLAEEHEEHIKFLQRKLAEAEKKEISIWDKYTEEGMPKAIFEKLKAKCEEEKKNLESALGKAYAEKPQCIDYEDKISRFYEALDLLKDDSVSAEVKNRFLKTIIDRIEYDRKPSIRMSEEDAKNAGIKTNNGWYSPDFILDIHIKV